MIPNAQCVPTNEMTLADLLLACDQPPGTRSRSSYELKLPS